MTGNTLRQVLWLTLLLLGNVANLAWASPTWAADPLTPVIGVNPQALDFGVLEPGACSDDVVELRNAADDPQSQLVISALTVTPPFSLVDPPTPPFTIPGDGTSIVALTVRYCASGAGAQIGALTITATHAENSPLLVPLEGVSNRPPSCDAGGPYSGVTGVPIAMTGAGSSDPDGTIVAYRWDFGDGHTGSGATPTHIYTAPGTFDIELTVTDNWEVSRACATSAEVATVSLPLSPVIGVNPTALDFGIRCPGACPDAMVSVRNAVNDPQSRLVISDLVVTPPFALVDPPPIPLIILGDGSQVHLTLRYCAAGSGPEVGSLAIHANATNSPLTVPLSGTADPPPQCAAGGPYFGQPNQLITFDGRGSSDPGGAIVSYAWDFGDGATGTGPTPAHTYGLKNTYVVGLAVADACGSATTSQTTAIVSNNALPICDAGGPYTGFTGAPIAMSGAGSSDPDGVIVDYRWDFGDGQTATGVTPSHTYTDPGLFTVSLTVFDDQGANSNCSTTAEVDVPGDPNAPPICDAGGPYRGVVGRPVTFDGTDSHDPDGIVVAYIWAFGDGQTATGATPSHTYSAPGFFRVSLQVTDDDGATSICSTSCHVIDLSPDFNLGRPAEGRPGKLDPVQAVTWGRIKATYR